MSTAPAVEGTAAPADRVSTAATERTAVLSNRERLIDAMAEAIAGRGFRESTVADVVRIARTSRRTFYEHFPDRAACFLALFDATNDAMMAQITAAVDPASALDRQVEDAIDAYIDNVTAHPALYHSFVRELPGLGEAGADRVRAVTERFARLLVELVDASRTSQPELQARALGLDTAVMIVGGMRELAVLSMQQGRDVRELRPSVVQAVKAILAGALL